MAPEYPTLAKLWFSPCHQRPVWLIVRGRHRNPVTWRDVPCTECSARTVVVIDLLKEAQSFIRIQAVHSSEPDVICWAIPKAERFSKPQNQRRVRRT